MGFFSLFANLPTIDSSDHNEFIIFEQKRIPCTTLMALENQIIFK